MNTNETPQPTGSINDAGRLSLSTVNLLNKMGYAVTLAEAWQISDRLETLLEEDAGRFRIVRGDA